MSHRSRTVQIRNSVLRIPAEVVWCVWCELLVRSRQVCQKWLKDRKGRVLEHADLQHYGNVVAALAQTIELMQKIDAAIEAHGGWPLQGSAET